MAALSVKLLLRHPFDALHPRRPLRVPPFELVRNVRDWFAVRFWDEVRPMTGSNHSVGYHPLFLKPKCYPDSDYEESCGIHGVSDAYLNSELNGECVRYILESSSTSAD